MERIQRPAMWGKTALACAFSAMLAAQNPSAALAATKAELQQQMSAAQSRISELNAQAEVCEYDLMNVNAALDETNGAIDELNEQIPQTEAELDAAKQELGQVVAESYRNGTPTLIDVIMGATSFDDMVSRVVYANKISEHEREIVEKTKSISEELNQQKSDLEEEQSEQERLVAEQEEKLAATQQAASEAQNYYNGLSSELQTMIEEEQAAARAAAAEAAAAAAAEAQRKADAEATQQTTTQSTGDTQQGNAQQGAGQQGANQQGANQQQGTSSQNANQPDTGNAANNATQTEQTPTNAEQTPAQTPAPTPEPDPEPVVSTPVSTPAPVANVPSAGASGMVARAYSIIGAAHSYSGYNWTGDVSSSYFTCSGVVDYALGLPSHSNSPESYWAAVGSRMVYDPSQLNYGDLVFYPYAGRYPGHVGIYVGGGAIIDSIPNGGVQVRDVNYMTFIGGGPL